MALNFPFGMFLQAQLAKNQNQQQALADAQGIGQNLGGLGQAFKEMAARSQWENTVDQLVASDQVPPQLKAMAPLFKQHPELLGQGGLKLFEPNQDVPIHINPQGQISLLGPGNQPPSLSSGTATNPDQYAGSNPPPPPGFPSMSPPQGGLVTRVSREKLPGLYEAGLRMQAAEQQRANSAEEKAARAAERSDATQDRLEKLYTDRVTKVVQARTGGLGLQDSKVNQAIDLRTMINQYFDPQTGTYNIPPAQHSELALGLARLLSPSGQVGIQMEETLRQKTAREGLAGALIFMGLDPLKMGGTTQGVAKMFVDSIDRQGLTSENLRDKYVAGLKRLKPEGLSQDRANAIATADLTSSFKDILDQSPDRRWQATITDAAQGGLARPSGIKPGTVMDGYRFRGGDPADKANWVKLR